MSGWAYQDNMIAKYNVLDGHEVTVIANQYVYDKKGNYIRTDKTEEIDCNGVKILRLAQIGDKMLKGPAERVHYKGLYEALVKGCPDIIFLHNPQIMDVEDIIRYIRDSKAKNKDVKLYVDSHSDYSNSARNFLSKHILHGILWRSKIKKLVPYTDTFFGVLPARVDFLIERYHTPKDKTKLLVMGMDDEIYEKCISNNEPDRIRKQLNINEDDFVIVTGGKIDHAKQQTLLLMEAVKSLNKKIRLIIFGSVVDDMQEEFLSKCDDTKISYIGWLDANETYPYFSMADLVVFPGRHSVMWEQVSGQGIPMVCKYWDGTTHVDVGGNAIFLHEDSVEEIKTVLDSLCDKGENYQKMKKIAREKGREKFSYRKIARQAIGEEEIN